MPTKYSQQLRDMAAFLEENQELLEEHAMRELNKVHSYIGFLDTKLEDAVATAEERANQEEEEEDDSEEDEDEDEDAEEEDDEAA